MHIFAYIIIKCRFVKRHYVKLYNRLRLPLNVLIGVQLIRSKVKY